MPKRKPSSKLKPAVPSNEMIEILRHYEAKGSPRHREMAAKFLRELKR